MSNRRIFSALPLFVALIPLSVACSGTTDATSEQEAAMTDQALSPTTSAVAFQGKSGNEIESGPQYTGDTLRKMKAGTSPSIAEMDGFGNYNVAFQDNNGYLYVTNTTNYGFGMDPKSSPSLSAATGGGYYYAFQANTHFLWVVGTAGILQYEYYGMMAGTSPSITALPDGGWEAAFQANTGELYVTGTRRSGPTGYWMWPGTSPSIAATPDGKWLVAFEEQGGHLFYYGPDGAEGDSGYGMENTSSPSISPMLAGGWQVAFKANTSGLWVGGGTNVPHLPSTPVANTPALLDGTSPSITALPGGGWEAAFQSNDGHYWLAGTQATGATTGLMAPGTSPSICPVYPAPTGFGGSAPTIGTTFGIQLHWNAVPGASKYIVNNTYSDGYAQIPPSGSLTKTVTGTSSDWNETFFGYSHTYGFTVQACFPNGFCGKTSNEVRVKTPAKPGSGGGGGNTGTVGVYYYMAQSSNLNCNSLTMTGSLSPGSFASNSSTGALTGQSNCPGMGSGSNCCAFYLGASGLAAGNYTMKVNAPQCSETLTFSLATNSSTKQFSGYGVTCPK